MSRRSMKVQVGQALNSITRIGESRHEAKLRGEHWIHSIATRNEIGQRLMHLAKWAQGHGIKDVHKLTPDHIRSYLDDRLAHHVSKGNAFTTYSNEISALVHLEHGLSVTDQQGRQFDFCAARLAASRQAQDLLQRTTSTYKDRAYPEPARLVDAIRDRTHQLQSRLMLEAGPRTEGAGAPSCQARNPLQEKNFHDKQTGQPLLHVKDPVTGQEKAAFWTCEKGGKIAYHFCSTSTAREILKHIEMHGSLESKYEDFLASVNQAAKDTGQYHAGRGTHGLRHNFAQTRYDQATRAGYADEQAKLLVSKEMSHERPSITETYLR